MKRSTKYIVPGLLAGAVLITTGASAYAFGGDMLPKWNADAFASFTADEQSAIEESFTIMDDARTEADAVLADAGLTKEDVQDAVRAYHDAGRQAVTDAIENDDYSAFVTAVANTPLADANISNADFANIVEAYGLAQDGDFEGARAIIDSLDIDGHMLGMIFPHPEGQGPDGEHGPRDGHGPLLDKEQTNS